MDDDDFDTPWKDVLMQHFPEFMAFYFPLAHAAIDWSRPHTFLDQEFSALAGDAELGKCLLDKLVSVYLRNWDRQRIINLYRVIDWIMRLPQALGARPMCPNFWPGLKTSSAPLRWTRFFATTKPPRPQWRNAAHLPPCSSDRFQSASSIMALSE
ncbi:MULTISPECIES: hypothetical protein [unclassified Duganella]|uniref:hypothetical protein n=1 Tax=unclassified Duganella TaxID=2636909 RepID=UPI001E5D091D|nr:MULTISPECIES: hypothetical protein [unclassified Duganella]